MEADSKKKKRGRPTVFTRMLGDDDFADVIRAQGDVDSERSITNRLYYHEGLSIAQKVCNTSEIFYTPKGNCRRNCILEQIGRMSLQNNYDQESCEWALKVALRALEEGFTVREIERYLRHGRNYNEWTTEQK